MRALFAFITCACILHVGLTAQNSDKEVIIIEKTVDEHGNEISKKITRQKGEDLSDDQIERLLQEDERPFGQWDIESLGFGPNAFDGWDDWLNDGSKEADVTIGLSLSFDNGRTSIIEVYPGTGADDSDLRAGDEIVSIEGNPIASYDDIKKILEDKSTGDEIRITIYRDGTEIEKFVILKRNRTSQFSFDLPEEMGAKQFFFDFSDSDFGMDIDSIFKSFGTPNLDSLLKNFGMIDGHQFRSYREPNRDRVDLNRANRASLGVLVDDRPNGGVVIAEVLEQSAADNAGMQSGDIIQRIDDDMVTSYRELSMLISRRDSGDIVSIQVLRRNKQKTLKVTLD